MQSAKRARQRAEVILKVRAGRMTAAEGAQLLGVSRKSYYEWEQRGLAGMLQQLADRPTGRPRQTRDPEKARLRRQMAKLQQRLKLFEQTAKLRGQLRHWEQMDAKKNARR
jgi:transposase